MPTLNQTIQSIDIGNFIDSYNTAINESTSIAPHKHFHICRIEHLDCIEALKSPRIYDFYTIYFVDEGMIEKTHQIDKIHLESHQLFFSIPGEIKVIEKIVDAKGYLISFSEDFLLRLTNCKNLLQTIEHLNPNRNRKFSLSDKNFKSFTTILKELEREFENPTAHSSDLIRFKLFELMIKSTRLTPVVSENSSTKKPGKSCHFIYTRFLDVVEETYRELTLGPLTKPLMVKEFAERLNINPTYLGECVRKASGVSAKSIINKRTLLLAKCELIHTNDNIAEIAYRMGFESSGYFIRFFKKFEGATPLYYRNQNRVSA